MKHYGLEIPEGTTGVVNLTVPSGASFPNLENAGELFFRTDENKLYVHGTGTGSPTDWLTVALGDGGIENVVEDTSPQLGGDLDANGFDIQLQNGTNSAPSLTFGSDTDTGLYRSAADRLTFTGAGFDHMTVGGLVVQMSANTQLRIQSGTQSAPGIAFTGDPNTGLYLKGSDNLVISVGNTELMDLTSLSVAIRNGSTSFPSLRFVGQDTNDGFYYNSTDDGVGYVYNGIEYWLFDGSVLKSVQGGRFSASSGNSTTPGIYFGNNSGTGFHTSNADRIIFAIEGSDNFTWLDTQHISHINGSAGAPTFTWLSDLDTGIYHTTDKIHFSTDGNQRMAITDDGLNIISTGALGSPVPSTNLLYADGTDLYWDGIQLNVVGGGSGINNVVEDLTPQLGGDLDANGKLVKLADGTSGAPSLTFGTDIDTGMFASSADTIGFTTGGTSRLRITSDGTIEVATTDYETLVTSDDDIPNRKYVTDNFLQDVVDDTTPQLGGDLDTNGSDIIFGTNDNILGDFSNATVDSRTSFITTALNSTTWVLAKPSGTGASSSFIAVDDSDATNATFGSMGVDGTGLILSSGKFGSGTFKTLRFHTNGAKRLEIMTDGMLQADFSNGAENSRVAFQTSTADGNSIVQAKPNGTGNAAFYLVCDDADATNCSTAFMGIGTAGAIFASSRHGTGSYGPMRFQTSATQRFRIETNGRLNVGDTLVYETLVTDDDDIPNKKYVDDKVVAGTFTHPDPHLLNNNGVPGAPEYSFAGDANTGMYNRSSDELAFSTGGSLRLRILNNGVLSVDGTTNYETLVTADDNLTNKKYVDDTIVTNAMQDVVEDTTPQLGGNLEANGFDILLQSGSAADPSLTFTSDADTGMYRSAANTINFSTNGIERLKIDATPLATLSGDLTLQGVDAGATRTLQFYWPETVIPSLSQVGAIEFSTADSSNPGISSAIYAYATVVNQGSLEFHTGVGGSAIKRLEIEIDGTLNVAGTTDYETLVTTDDDIPNKKYVDDAITTGTTHPDPHLLGDGTNSAPTYSFSDDTNTGMYSHTSDGIAWAVGGNKVLQVDEGQGLNIISATYNRHLTITRDAATDEIWQISPSTDGSLDFSQSSTAGGSEAGYLQGSIRWIVTGGTAALPAYSFTASKDMGMYRDGTDILGFSTAGTQRLEIEADGTLNVSGTTGYEALVTADDDIPNKKYVDDNTLGNVVEDLSPQLGANLDVNTFTITGLPATPTLGTEATSKNYVDGVSAGLDPKESCRVASTENIAGTFASGSPGGVGTTLTLTGSPTASLTIDGVTLANDDRVMLKDQTSALQNGIYVVSGVGTAVVLTRAEDFDDSPTNEVDGGEYAFIVEGTVNAGSGYVVISTLPVHMDNDDIIWSQHSGGNQFLPLAGGTMSGNIAMGSNDITGVDDITATGVASRIANHRFTATNLDLGQHGSGDRNSNLYFISSDADEANYSMRFRRNSGANGAAHWYQRGSGDMFIIRLDPGSLYFRMDDGDTTRDIIIGSDGVLQTANPTYETLVTSDDDIPNKKYVDDEISSNAFSHPDPHLLSNNGIPGAPEYSFAGDTDTGMYSASSDQLNFSTGGSHRLQILNNGVIAVGATANYETLITHDDSLTNKKYVDDNTIGNVVEDLTPQLGGSLDANTFAITNLNEVQAADGSATDPSFTFTNDLDTGMYLSNTGILTFSTAGVDRVKINSNGLAVYDDGGSGAGLWEVSASNTAGSGSRLVLMRARGTLSSPSAVTNSDNLGELIFQGYIDGNYRSIAYITGRIPPTGTVSATSYPSELVFETTPDGSTTPAIVLIIEDDGTLNVSDQTDYEDQVTHDDDIPNKKYVDDAITTGHPDPHLLGNGTAGAPTYSFSGDTDTGFWRDTSNQINISIAGSERWQLNNSLIVLGTTGGSGVISTVSSNGGLGLEGRSIVGDSLIDLDGVPNTTADDAVIRHFRGTDVSGGGVAYDVWHDPNTSTGNVRIGANISSYFRLYPVSFADGSSSTPSIRFYNDTDTGFYMRTTGSPEAPDGLGVTVNGTNRLTFETNGTLNVSGTTTYEVLVTDDDDIPNKKYVDDAITTAAFTHPDPHLLGDGSAGAPTYSFSSDSDTGMSLNGVGELRFSSGGTNRLYVSSTAVTVSTVPFHTISGTVGAPSHSFVSDTDTGMYLNGTGNLSFSTGGNERFRIKSDGSLEVNTSSYETLVTADSDIPNKKYVDDVSGNLKSLTATTTNATETELGTDYLTIATDTTYVVDMYIVARRTDALGSPLDRAAWNVKCLIENNSGATVMVGETVETEISNDPAWGISVIADDTNDRLAVKVTGEAAKTIKWKANITHVSVS